MGLFDKLKRAFSGPEQAEDEEKEKLEEQDKAQEQKEKEETEEETPDQADKSVDDEKQTQIEDETTKDQAEPETKEDLKKQARTSDDETSDTKEIKDAEEKKETEEDRYDQGLKKSRQGFGAKINALLANFRHVDEDFFDDLEETLIESDVGFETAVKISDELQDEVKLRNAKSKSDVSDAIVEKLVDLYEKEGQEEDNTLHFAKNGPTVFLFVGVNGVGKTTTIGKLAHKYQQEGKKVLLAACDTFRAGAIEQLDEWAQRVDVDIVKKPAQSDPAAVVFDAVKRAQTEDYDVLLVDTAGRLQNKVNLMNELAKIKRVIKREIPDSPQEVLLALDATTGQNALTQAKQFKDVTEVSGIVLTKLDGTARGGIVLAIRNELHLPVKLVGLGEQMDDLRDFDAEKFVYGLFKDLVAQTAK
ncbi:signal recognition particle-docking protein FtsY [Ligilactobacillus pobuzihii]|uniref:Signal recognition particle receptor FtsY n=1 Tax=Ligilactobacillus pobuzihii TaxID=449659 RepID=A0A0R2LLT7_9LACO|nr:signal recognition particle-docking protein FtsY [Ligilactobacillus pobuzihii]KRK11326.1 signal recognition particle-docking protein FtsY [Ligilactobacillus pobuzihii E100301 = KCTC 13174]KRO02641.1 signal recognition particle-docking protein FtsY [Ligilactobacillus pobuzihii]GEN47407.1 signal recognition particle receptor FtsY [Ligilactobacillus pobuzihii]